MSQHGCGRNQEQKHPDETTIPAENQEVKNSPCMELGEEVYSNHCLVCHQSNGAGVGRLNPPLVDTEYVLGTPEQLISILLKGSNVGLVVNGAKYSNAMPGFSYLSDEEIACVATYIRNSFGNRAKPVSPGEVERARLP